MFNDIYWRIFKMKFKLKTHAVLIFTFVILLIPQSAFGIDWSFSHNLTASTFTDYESDNSVSVSGTLHNSSTGFLRKYITASSGTGAPATSSNIFGIEVPGYFFFQEPTSSQDNQIIYTAETGVCPDVDFNFIFTFAHWKLGGAEDMTSNSQGGFGVGNYDASAEEFNITNIYSLNNYSSVPWFSATITLSTSGCTDGLITVDGNGDRGGSLFMSGSGGFVFRTNGDKTIMGMRTSTIPSAASPFRNLRSLSLR